jgi:hypothetical protein
LLLDQLFELAEVVAVHREHRKPAVELYVQMRAFARREGCALLFQPTL